MIAASLRFSYSWKIPLSTLKETVENNCFAKFIVLSLGYDDGEANRCNRLIVAEGRSHEGKPYFRDIERKVWLFYEVNCHRKAPSKTSFSPHCFRLKYGSNLTLSILIMGNVEFLALMPQNAKYVYFSPFSLYTW